MLIYNKVLHHSSNDEPNDVMKIINNICSCKTDIRPAK